MVAVNSFVNGVDSLNTSLLLAVQRLAKIAEESSKEITQDGKDDGVNQIDPGRCVNFTNLENTVTLYFQDCQSSKYPILEFLRNEIEKDI